MRLLRRGVVNACCVLHRRFTRRLRKYPWPLIRLGDTRVPMAARVALWDNFIQSSVCCMEAGFARKLAAAARDNEAPMQYIESRSWQQIWCWLGWLVTLQCVDVEWRHARNRARNNHYGQNTNSQLAAKYVCAEAMVCERARVKEDHAHRQLPEPNPHKINRSPESWLRSPTPLELFRHEHLAAERYRGNKVNPAKRETHAAVAEAWKTWGPMRRSVLSRKQHFSDHLRKPTVLANCVQKTCRYVTCLRSQRRTRPRGQTYSQPTLPLESLKACP